MTVETQIDKLLSQMTLLEKVGQMCQLTYLCAESGRSHPAGSCRFGHLFRHAYAGQLAARPGFGASSQRVAAYRRTGIAIRHPDPVWARCRARLQDHRPDPVRTGGSLVARNRPGGGPGGRARSIGGWHSLDVRSGDRHCPRSALGADRRRVWRRPLSRARCWLRRWSRAIRAKT